MRTQTRNFFHITQLVIGLFGVRVVFLLGFRTELNLPKAVDNQPARMEHNSINAVCVLCKFHPKLH
ncbi:hypothetical protein B0H10DRAFT_813454 [Mycena sp. CBHHK59/15]|nr:hypothetical protein B0H10DRAFT_813454 [Mycena sp. CBHHK59/15]